MYAHARYMVLIVLHKACVWPAGCERFVFSLRAQAGRRPREQNKKSWVNFSEVVGQPQRVTAGLRQKDAKNSKVGQLKPTWVNFCYVPVRSRSCPMLA